MVSYWHDEGVKEEQILFNFMDFDDRSLIGETFLKSGHKDIADVSYRLLNRILPLKFIVLAPLFRMPRMSSSRSSS